MSGAQAARPPGVVATPHLESADAVFAQLGSDPERGLTVDEARARLTRFGRNELRPVASVSAFRRFLGQLHDPLVWLLLAATAISLALWVYERDTALPYEALVIFTVVLLDATMGFLQEARAERAIEALQTLSAAQAHVIRGGARARARGRGRAG